MDDEQAIRNLIANWLSASKAGDTETVLGLMSDDVVFLVCGQPPMRGKEAFAAGQAGLKDIEIDATSEIQEIKVLEDWAYVWTHLSVAFRPRSGGAANNAPAIHSQSCENKKANGDWFVTPTCLRPSLRRFPAG